jgi:hypothetical protein
MNFSRPVPAAALSRRFGRLHARCALLVIRRYVEIITEACQMMHLDHGVVVLGYAKPRGFGGEIR